MCILLMTDRSLCCSTVRRNFEGGEKLELKEILRATGAEEEIPSCEIYVDEEGEWFHKGNRITRENIVEFFYENLSRTPEGEFIIEWKGTRCRVEAADTPFVISRADRLDSTAGKEEILLSLRHVRHAEPLDPKTLWIGKNNIMYCHIRNGMLPARFLRPAYYQLAGWIQEEPGEGKFYLELNEAKYVVDVASSE